MSVLKQMFLCYIKLSNNCFICVTKFVTTGAVESDPLNQLRYPWYVTMPQYLLRENPNSIPRDTLYEEKGNKILRPLGEQERYLGALVHTLGGHSHEMRT